MSSSPTPWLDKSVGVFASTYAYSDGLLAAVQHLLALSASSSSSSSSPSTPSLVDRGRLVGLLSQTRAANRFMGTLNSVQWFQSVCAEALAPSKSVTPGLLLRRLNQVKALLMVLYHPLEHAAFLHDAAIFRFLSESAVARLWRLASSLWFVYVVCDLPTNFLSLQQTLEDGAGVQDAQIAVSPADVRPSALARALRVRRIKTDVLVLLLLRNFADLPLTLHYSFDGVRTLLSPRTRIALSVLSALLNIARLWRRADIPAAEQDDAEDD